jgi:hypothetical protein
MNKIILIIILIINHYERVNTMVNVKLSRENLIQVAWKALSDKLKGNNTEYPTDFIPLGNYQILVCLTIYNNLYWVYLNRDDSAYVVQVIDNTTIEIKEQSQ